ncbi:MULTISPECIES: DUF502 domain-containing protein [Hymenobacter]|uniref:DUF502 domain-containing protein n=1 Tax=Hymenobacter jejuensis TaxID=2502781 RepID=A0A5B7ZX77_9BACT|nr:MULTISPECIES: DUF502 domain-containing protein [Hymenobacter]MBC6988152.1 DUF502 domain-containing protein [Hymenobacter sp. BT491]QDA59477.1 DUF502 domain-containing protein [Hymenobacter jejuensis]
MRQYFNYFLNGFLIVAPIALTIYILYASIRWLNNLFNFYDIPGLGLLLAIVAITVIGYVAKSFMVRPFLIITERLLHRTPLVSIIYSSLKDLFDAFVGDNQKFNCPVLVRINEEAHCYKMGFVTQDSMAAINQEALLAVYFPHSYNFSGELVLVPKDNVTYLELPSSEVMKFIVSGGVSRL